MNFIEFIDLPQKEKNKIYRSKMITSFGAFAVSKEKFFEICNIEEYNDFKITDWSAYKRFGYVEIYIHAAYQNIPVFFTLNISKPTKTTTKIYTIFSWDIYKKVCDIFDSHPDHNNLEYHIFDKTLNDIYKNKCNSFQEFLDYFVNEYKHIKQICEEITPLFIGDGYEQIVNEFLPVKFKRGAGVIHDSHNGAIDFTSFVNLIHTFRNNFGNEYSYSDIAKYFYYINKRINKETWNDCCYITRSVFEQYLYGNVVLNKENIDNILKSFKKSKNKKSYAEYLFKANCEYYKLAKDLKERIANKYGIDEKEIWALFKPEDGPEYFIDNEVPDKFKNEYK